MESSPTESHDPIREAVATALLTALRRAEPALAELRVSVSAYARAARRSGKRPEEVVLELKSVLNAVAGSETLEPRGATNAMTSVSERAVRLAITAYFDDPL